MRIGSVDIYKFLFSLVICLYHFYGSITPRQHMHLGSVAVEFFCMAAGVFLFMSWDKNKEKPELKKALAGNVDASYIYIYGLSKEKISSVLFAGASWLCAVSCFSFVGVPGGGRRFNRGADAELVFQGYI